MLHPDFPVVENQYRITANWSMILPGRFNRRIEEGDLIIWRPGLTIYIAVWENDKSESPEERLNWLKGTISHQAYDIDEVYVGNSIFLNYRLSEEAEDSRVAAFYCFVIGHGGHVEVAIYFDQEEDLQTVKEVCLSFTENRKP